MKRGHAIALVCFIGLGAAFVLTEYFAYVRVETRESTAVSVLLVISGSQAEFIGGEHYGPGRKVYANPTDGSGLADLHRVRGGRVLNLIDASLAGAVSGRAPHAGYYYSSVPCDDYEKQFAVCAAPASYGRTGTSTFYLDTSGVVFEIDSRELDPSLRRGGRAKLLAARPSRDELMTKGWVPVAHL